jgi:hypothetical protein
MKHDMNKECGVTCVACECITSTDLCPSNRIGGDKWCEKCMCVACINADCAVGKL